MSSEPAGNDVAVDTGSKVVLLMVPPHSGLLEGLDARASLAANDAASIVSARPTTSCDLRFAVEKLDPCMAPRPCTRCATGQRARRRPPARPPAPRPATKVYQTGHGHERNRTRLFR